MKVQSLGDDTLVNINNVDIDPSIFILNGNLYSNETNDDKDFTIVNSLRGGDCYTNEICKKDQRSYQYGHGMGLLKKALELSLSNGNYDRLIGMVYNFIEDNKLQDVQLETSNAAEESIVRNPIIKPSKGRPRSQQIKSNVKLSVHKNKDKALNNITNINQEHDDNNSLSNQLIYIDNHLDEMNKTQSSEVATIDQYDESIVIIDKENADECDYEKKTLKKCTNCKEYGHYKPSCKKRKKN